MTAHLLTLIASFAVALFCMMMSHERHAAANERCNYEITCTDFTGKMHPLQMSRLYCLSDKGKTLAEKAIQF